MSRLRLPKIESNESMLDVSLLDIMDKDEFLNLIKNKTGNNFNDLWKELVFIIDHLKASRELISIGSSILVQKSSDVILKRLLDVTRTLLRSEKIALIEYKNGNLNVVQSTDDFLLGTSIPSSQASRSLELDVLTTKMCMHINDINYETQSVSLCGQRAIETAQIKRIKSVICVPIIVNDTAVGVLQAFNKSQCTSTASRRNTLTDSLSSSPTSNNISSTSQYEGTFGSNDAMLMTFISSSVSLACKQLGIGSQLEKSIPSINTSDSTLSHPFTLESDFELIQKIKTLENDVSFQQLVDWAYSKLDAERVSIFAYSPHSKSLICTVSQDIKGFVLPHDKGIAGLAFTANRIINIPDTTRDFRHNKEFDVRSQFTTRNLLCAPILNYKGVPVGVIQAVNKKNEENFSLYDENLILEIGATILNFIQTKVDSYNEETKEIPSNLDITSTEPTNISIPNISSSSFSSSLSNNVPIKRLSKDLINPFFKGGNSSTTTTSSASTDVNNSGSVSSRESLFSKFLLDLAESKSLEQLLDNFNKFVKTFTKFDIFHFYSLHKSNLVHIQLIDDKLDIDTRFSVDSCCIQLREALQFSVNIEFLPNSNKDSNILPNLSAAHAFIYPLTAKYYSFQPGKSVIILGSKDGCLTLTSKEKKEIETIIDFFNFSLLNLKESYERNETESNLLSKISILSASLASAPQIIFILNGDGQLIYSNKKLEDLLTLKKYVGDARFVDVDDILHSPESNEITKENTEYVVINRDNLSISPSSTNNIEEGSHFSEWLTDQHSPQLCRDIRKALAYGHPGKCTSARFTSSCVKHYDGISIDYSVSTFLDGKLIPKYNSPNDRVARGAKFGEDELVNLWNLNENSLKSYDELDDNKSKNSQQNHQRLVVVTILINSRHSMELEESIPLTPIEDLSQDDSALNFETKKLYGKSTLEARSAANAVQKASAILAAVKSNYVLSDTLLEEISKATNNLTLLSRKMSLDGASFSKLSLAAHPNLTNLESKEANPYQLLVNPSIPLPQDMFDWEFNILPITNSTILCNIMCKYFETMFDFDALGISPTILGRYIAEVSRHYHDRPFHNLQHSACVTHFAFKLINACKVNELLKPAMVLGILLSAVVHDVDHPGNTNLFEINSCSELAIRYNDQSVLENHHCSTAFRLMRKPNLQVLSNIPHEVSSEIRKTMIACIMATDMAVHFALIDETKERYRDNRSDFNYNDPKDQLLLAKVLLHAADLSNPVRPFYMAEEWARRVSIEFNDQVEREQALGMPVLGFMMTPDEKSFCKNESGFASFVVQPMWVRIVQHFPVLEFLTDQLSDNVDTWKLRYEKHLAEEEKQSQEEAAKTETHSEEKHEN